GVGGRPRPGARLRRGPPDPRLAALTDREGEVLRAMARGLSNTEITTHLTVGTETVKSHLSAVLSKLGARDRTQAVIAAYESGFVSPGWYTETRRHGDSGPAAPPPRP
ncbi:hypothetical protein B5181_43440, partial [Streptomyces sp. 4F]